MLSQRKSEHKMNAFHAIPTMIVREIEKRAFIVAAENIREFGRIAGTTALLRIIKAVCQSYDQLQLNVADDNTWGRVDMVRELVMCVMDTATLVFVCPETALAFGFYPFSRAAFIDLCCQLKPKHGIDTVFANKIVADLLPSGLLRKDSDVAEICLRNLYWGRGSEEHALEFMQRGMAPFFTSRHIGESYKYRLHSLIIEPPKRSFMFTAAEAAKLNLLRRSNTSLTENFFDVDPDEKSDINDALTVARSLKVEFYFQTRFYMPVWTRVNSIDKPFYYSEKAAAAELLICLFEPIRLPPYVLLEIIDWLYDMGEHRKRFVENVNRVYLKTTKLRQLHTSNKK